MSRTVSACSCGPRPTVLDAFETVDEVVIVRVLSVEKAEDTEKERYVDGVRSATMIVEKVFKGNLKIRDEIIFGQGSGANCLSTYDEKSVGDQYLYYLMRPERRSQGSYLPSTEPAFWYVSFCGRSRGVAAATDDLLYLENLKKVRGKTRISGTIGGGWQYPDLEVEGKKIKIIGPKKTYETKNDKNGVFEIYDLPPGKYFIEPEIPAGWKIDPSWLRYSSSVVTDDYGEPEIKSLKQVAVMLEPKKHAGVNIAFTVDNFVRGRVLGPKGRPLPDVCVYLLRPGQNEWGPSDCTDKQGRFEISSIPTDEYVLVANQDDKPSYRRPFRRIFYPGVTERERAAVISVAPGQTIDNIDIVISKLEETIVVKGVLQYSDGNPVVDGYVKFKVTKTNDKVDGDVMEQTDSTGHFTMRILKGLTGELWSEDWLYKGGLKNCPKVDELIAKSGRKSVTVKSNIVELTTDQDVYEVELTLPFPRCEKAKE
jgi:hypothetical protein